MKKKLKLIILLLAVASTYLIYNLNDKNNITYISIGDSLSLGENSYGATNYGYSDYFKDYLEKNNLLSTYNKTYTSKTKTINDLYKEVLLDDSTQIDNHSYNLKRLLRDSEIVSLSIGINDLIFEYNIRSNQITEYEEDRIVNNVFNNYKNLIEEIKKYYHYPIYIIGYYENNTKYDHLIRKLNDRYKNYSEEENDIYIDTTFISKNNIYFDNSLSYYPNSLAYKKIAKKMIKSYQQNK